MFVSWFRLVSLLGTYISLTILNSSFEDRIGSVLSSLASGMMASGALAELGDLGDALMSLRKSCSRCLSVRGVEDD